MGQAEGALGGSPASFPSSPYYRPVHPPIHAQIKGPVWASDTTHLHSPSALPQSWELGTASRPSPVLEETGWAGPAHPSPILPSGQAPQNTKWEATPAWSKFVSPEDPCARGDLEHLTFIYR